MDSKAVLMAGFHLIFQRGFTNMSNIAYRDDENMNHDLNSNSSGDGVFIYNALFEKIREEYGETVYQNWFQHIKFKDMISQTLTLVAPSSFVREWIISNYFTKIYKILEDFGSFISRINIIVEGGNSAAQENLNHNTINNNSYYNPEVSFNKDFSDISSTLNSKFGFESFVVGSSNKMAFAAAEMMADFFKENESNSDNNILFIHGSVGMGKTHLLQSISSSVTRLYPEKKAGYLSAEKFMHKYMIAVKRNDLIGFKENFRSLDILLFDDLQFICDKHSTQKEFANTINALIESNKRIVIACDRSPYQLELDPRTKSRITGGIIAEINPADFDFRVRVLKNRLENMQLDIDEEIVNFLADNITSNIRELEGALNKIVTYCTLNDIKMTLDLCKSILKDCLKAHEQDISILKIVQSVADSNGVTKSEILSKSRLSKLVYLRQMIAYLSKKLTKFSLQEIGKHLGGKDHATIIYCIRQFEQKLERNPMIAEDLSTITRIVKDHIGSA